jgi:hypothetical protein
MFDTAPGDDLVARLTSSPYTWCSDALEGEWCDFCEGLSLHSEAAARITELEAENAQWREFADITMTSADDLRAGLAEYRAQNAARAENARLREAGALLDNIVAECVLGPTASKARTAWAAALSGEPT